MNPISFQVFLVRITLALLLGGLVGLEREKHGRPAGFRTNILVCMGAALVMMSSQQLYALFQTVNGASSVARVDPGRIASGIIMGIGFLGAGAIMRQETITRGLTTAACLWLVTGVGIALGLGMYWWAVSATVLALIVLLPLKRLEALFNTDRYGTVSLAGDATAVGYEAVKRILEAFGVKIQSYRIKMDSARTQKSFIFFVKFAGDINPEAITERLASLGGVRSVHWH